MWHNNNAAGFTVLEVVIAIVVLSIGLMAAAMMQTQSVTEANSANRQSQRVSGSTQWIEDLLTRTITSEGDLTVADILSDNCTADRECADGTWYPDPPLQYESTQLSYRVIDGIPLPNLVTIEVRAVPRGMEAAEPERKAVVLRYVRSKRFN
jgi:prepilin-type N-terminal cleavage/methylation domain-containing protein